MPASALVTTPPTRMRHRVVRMMVRVSAACLGVDDVDVDDDVDVVDVIDDVNVDIRHSQCVAYVPPIVTEYLVKSNVCSGGCTCCVSIEL